MTDKEEFTSSDNYYISKKEHKVMNVFVKLREFSMINRGDLIKQLEEDNPLRIAYEEAYKEYEQKLNEEIE
jgi:hypothetical protein